MITAVINSGAINSLVRSNVGSFLLNFSKVAIYGAGVVGRNLYKSMVEDLDLIIISPLALSTYQKMKTKVVNRNSIWLRDMINLKTYQRKK